MADPYTLANGQERWRARWRTGNGERQCRSGFLTEGKAVAHEERMRTARREGKPERRPKTRLTVDDYFWEKWWPEEVTLAKSRGTQQSYRSNHLSYIAPRVGRLRLTELGHSEGSDGATVSDLAPSFWAYRPETLGISLGLEKFSASIERPVAADA
jgi:hypothetical protein